MVITFFLEQIGISNYRKSSEYGKIYSPGRPGCPGILNKTPPALSVKQERGKETIKLERFLLYIETLIKIIRYKYVTPEKQGLNRTPRTARK
jgi:hypothetical protein